MRNFGNPVVPVFIHQVVDNFHIGFVKVRIHVGRRFTIFDVADEQNLCLVGGEQETVDAFFNIGNLFAVFSVWIHSEKLHSVVGG